MANKNAALKKPSEHQLVVARIDQYTALREKLGHTKQEFGDVSNRLNSLQHELYAAVGECNCANVKPDHHYSVHESERASIEAEHAKKLALANQREERARRGVEEAQARFTSLAQEINALEKTLSDMRDGGGTSIDDLLVHQHDIDAARAQISSVETAIERQREIVTTAEAKLLPGHGLAAKREDIAAAVALGNASEADLANIDAEIAQHNAGAERVAAEVNPVVSNARQTISGLERQADEARARLDNLNKNSAAALAMYLNSEAERIGAEYAELARDLSDRFVQLTALSELLRDTRQPNAEPITSPAHYDFLIPAFRLKACKDSKVDNLYRQILFTANGLNVDEDKELILNRLREQGIEF